jgi:hypothetical protein
MKLQGRKVVGIGRPRRRRTSPPPVPNKRGNKAPNTRERAFVEGVAEGKSDRQVALNAGYSLSIAENTKYKLWTKPQVQDYYRRIAQAAAPPEWIVRKMNELIEGKIAGYVPSKRPQIPVGQLCEAPIVDRKVWFWQTGVEGRCPR